MNHIILEDLRQITAFPAGWEKLKNKTVLITGASGMIASYLVYTLLYLNDTRQMGIRVLGLARSGEKAKTRFGALLDRADFSLLVQDVCTPVEIDQPVDVIIHAASQASPRQFTSDPVGTIRANTLGTDRLLETARQKGASFLLLSTREIYGVQPDGKEYAGEEDYGICNPALPRSCYPESKRLAETLCISYAAQFGVEARIARIAHTYGPGMTIGDGRVVGDFIYNVIQGQDIRLNSDGSGILGLTYISDLISGLFFFLLNSELQIANISGKNGVLSVRELAELLAGLFPKKQCGLFFAKADSTEKAGYLKGALALLDASLLQENGWQSSVSLRDGFLRTITYFEEENHG